MSSREEIEDAMNKVLPEDWCEDCNDYHINFFLSNRIVEALREAGYEIVKVEKSNE
jgi:hypothetical protein